MSPIQELTKALEIALEKELYLAAARLTALILDYCIEKQKEKSLAFEPTQEKTK